MGKIGRNEQCLCGSGRKYKHCCLLKEQAGVVPTTPEQQFKISLNREIAQIQQTAAEKRLKIRELGVFVLFSTAEGDAWLLEISESDALQLADKGEPVDVVIDENPETIEINWTHTFAIRDKILELTAYADKVVTPQPGYPTKEIHAAIARIKKKFSAEMLNRVHVSGEDQGADQA
ncbi:MAG: SEC-C domain-containing protein [Desulfobulbaceae bacterium]|uniref:SEC-C domain-containing protein n=1 Tax=Candidatus Desulfatifera sulfidica TaxID=2841691 RepID=A0A8J6N6Q3_9BACT|nr:SEC-C domain-containing protein [Candidatus Desulfatifera sulfidica]